MGYIIKKRESYKITGAKGEYTIPAITDLSIDDVELLTEYSESQDAKRKVEICKEFLLKYAPDLEKEEIGDMQYFMIFNDYNTSQGQDLGE